MKQPEKWRDTVEPFSIKFKKFNLIEVLGYPHAKNDVFYVKGIFNNKEVFAFLKYDRGDADFKNEVETLQKLKINNKPQILEFDEKEYKYILTKEIVGERLSTIVGENKKMQSLEYMFEFGKLLAKIHSLKGDFTPCIKRKFHNVPDKEYFEKNNIPLSIYEYLLNNKPKRNAKCFVHGDMHYANVLWNENKQPFALDFELSGMGWRDFDIAWSMFLRPSQKFFKTQEEIDEYIRGYKSIKYYNERNVKYYMV